MKLGILGTGMIVQEFLPWLVEQGPFTVQAVCSTEHSAPLAQELCRQYGVPQHTTNYLELLQWVDVVYIAVPNMQHTRFVRVALEAGCCMLLPSIYIDDYCLQRRGEFFPLEDYENHRHFYACYRKDEFVPRYVRDFIQITTRVLASQQQKNPYHA